MERFNMLLLKRMKPLEAKLRKLNPTFTEQQTQIYRLKNAIKQHSSEIDSFCNED